MQFIHYILQSSKTKSLAFKRLLDASNAGKLRVLTLVVKLGAELSMKWTKRDRETKIYFRGQMALNSGNDSPKTTYQHSSISCYNSSRGLCDSSPHNDQPFGELSILDRYCKVLLPRISEQLPPLWR